ncbi:leucine-rich repeats and immunoglobulin-like domains protein 3 isoform X2 [Copidosoma floridanum]|uniref:leucine-rich repeats and immunoglobulin-like domains protein 3 isoform X2 n=1 Tax=Copidosoma floridanum TaxID=29053 RepID=UPI0006C9AA48|nr:leucine-rich repeats and immunoglobulin-like domains protein 3 isoform X2 [Copidosoma floridanum]
MILRTVPATSAWLLQVLFFTVHIIKVSSGNQCPVECSCLGNAVICKDLQLVGAPNDLPPWTENLILKGNNFSNLEFNVLLNLPKLQELDVNSNVLVDNFTLTLSNETQLKWLKLNKNRLTRIPALKLLHLTHLSLSHNKIDVINQVSYPELQYLDLSNNKIYKIQKSTFFTSQLRSLNLNSNQLKNIENDSFKYLSSLQELRLNKNHLLDLKDYLRKLDKLRILEVNRNQLREVEALTFKEMRSLEKLHLKRNKIDSLNDGAFWQLNSLIELQLDYNALNVVSKGALFGLDHLLIFTLSHNKISSIEPQSWEMCKEIKELDLSYNELNRIERLSFAALRKLRKLQLDHNSVLYIAEGAFKDLISLKVLELNSNKISYIVEDAIGIFVPLNQLQKLGIAYNQIKSIHKNAFSGLTQITELDLTGNNITSIQENAFSTMTSTLTSLKINTSTLFCDCGHQWLSVWLHSKRYSDTNIQCGYPHWLQEKSLTQLHHANFTCDGFPKPRIVEEPHGQMSIKGDNVTLKCGATSTANTSLNFTWKRDNVELNNDSLKMDYVLTSSNGLTVASSVLHLINITNIQAGRYQCMVSNNYGTSYSSKAKINVLVYPSFLKKPEDIRVTAGSTARLECSATGSPTPQIAWQKDGGNDFPAARERRMHKMPTDDVLFIVNTKPSDSGVYSCTAQNLAGIISINASLTILDPPSFIEPMVNKEAVVGASAVLQCMASGSPKPQLFWQKNGSPLQTTERHFLTAENQLLIIVGVVPTDAGNYECEISNSLGSVKGISRLCIKDKPILSERDIVGLIIITVVCCAVGTSIVWVVVIYQTRKRLNVAQISGQPTPALVASLEQQVETHLYFDTSSQHSKDSGTGEKQCRMLLVMKKNQKTMKELGIYCATQTMNDIIFLTNIKKSNR